MRLAPIVALSHGGGPLPLLGDPSSASIVSSLRTRIPKILGLDTPSPPRAIVLVTAHWTTRTPTISVGSGHDLLYDYYGFPDEAYAIKYPAPGSPSVAEEVRAAMSAEGLDPELDMDRGWDHGVFVPMKLVRPEADVPIVQISVLASEDPEMHLRMGRALGKLREKNIAIVGSGFASYHNIRGIMSMMHGAGAGLNGLKQRSLAWNEAVTKAATAEKEVDRWDGFKAWRAMPNNEEMHPSRAGGEHFMPLIVCAGAARDGEKGRMYKDDFVGLDIFTYYWGGEEVD